MAQIIDTIHALQQKKWWVSADGAKWKRKKMTTQHKANTVAWLVRNSTALVARYADLPLFDEAPDDVMAELNKMVSDPEGFMLGTPLVQALLRDLLGEVEPTYSQGYELGFRDALVTAKVAIENLRGTNSVVQYGISVAANQMVSLIEELDQ